MLSNRVCFVFENWGGGGRLNKCTCGFPSIFSMTMWPCRHTCHTPALELVDKGVCESLEFCFALLSGETDFTPLLKCFHLFLQAPQTLEHFQTPLLLWLLLFFLFFFCKASGLTLLFIT